MQEPTPPDDTPPESAPEPAVGDELLDLQERLIGVSAEDVLDFLNRYVVNPSVGWQFLTGFLLIALAVVVGPRLVRLVAENRRASGLGPRLRAVGRTLSPLAAPVLLYLLLGLATVVAEAFGQPKSILESLETLAAAWVVIRLASLLVRATALSRIIFYVAWTGAALDILGLIEPTLAWLESVAIPVGEVRISLWTVFRALIAAGLLLFLSGLLQRLFERSLAGSGRVSPSMQILVLQLSRIALSAVAVVLALGFAGVDLTIFAVFSGAIAVGVGLGLQRTIANLMAGLQIIADKSIKPGDVIALDGFWGWVTKLSPRHVAIRTRDGIDHLIPNERFIRDGVENWSHEDAVLRRKLPIGVAYGSDVALVRRLCVEAARSIERVIDDPAPVCLMKGFGDFSLDFELRFWIVDPKNGLSNVESEVYLALYDRFRAHGVEIPFPRREVSLISDRPAGPEDAAAAGAD